MPELTAAMTAYIIFIAALLGLVMGSFLNCFAYRYANGESVLKGRSHCALCGHELSALDLVPIFSWLFLKGRCRYCGEKISFRYIVSELVLALAYVSVFLRFGLTLEALQFAILLSLLFTAAMTDIYCGLIPDRLVIIGAVCAFGFSAFFGYGSENGIWMSLLWTLINGLSVSLPLLLIVLAYEKISGKTAMGGGDIKLMFTIGLFFDWKLNIIILILACIIGIIFALVKRPDKTDEEMHGQQGAFSFGPALALSAWIVMLWGQLVLDWYLGFFIP